MLCGKDGQIAHGLKALLERALDAGVSLCLPETDRVRSRRTERTLVRVEGLP